VHILKKPIEERNLQPSTTSLFVTNLPFKFSDEDFAKIFTDAGVKPKSTKVIRRFNGRSRGYGFAEFENSNDQQKALNLIDKKTVEGRELVVKVAMLEPQQQGGAQQQAKPAQQTPQVKPAQQPAQTQQVKPAQQTPQVKPAQPAQQTQQQSPKPAQPVQQAQPVQKEVSKSPATQKK